MDDERRPRDGNDPERTRAFDSFWEDDSDDGPLPFWSEEIDRDAPPPGARELSPDEPAGPTTAARPTAPLRVPMGELPAEPREEIPPLEEIAFEPSRRPPTEPLLPEREPTLPVAADEPEPEVPVPEPRALPRRRLRTLALFAEALIPAGGRIAASASEAGVAERLDAMLSALDPSARKLLQQVLALWEWTPVLTRFRTFSRLSRAERAHFVSRSEGARSMVRRRAFQTLKIYCLNQWASTPEVEEAIGYDYRCISSEPPRDGAPLEVLGWPNPGRDHIEECDAVVIGSGAGGAVVAKELAEAGLSVVVLEEGGYFTRTDFAGPPWERFLRLYRAGGTTVALGNPIIPLPLGKAVGGTTLVNAGTCFRTPARVLQRWGDELGIEGIDEESMRPYFVRVERILRVKPVPEELLGPNVATFRRGVEKLGLNGRPLLRNIEGCRGCGACAFGCPSDAKQSTHISYLPRAQRHGAAIYARCRAERILVEGGRAAGVVASLLDPRTGEPRAALTVRAKTVFVAAGAIHSPALLAANALGNRSGQLGRNLRIHPATGVGAYFDEPVWHWRGTLQSFYVDDYHESDDIMFEVTNSVPSVGAGQLPGTGLEVKDLVARYPYMATTGLLVADTSSGRVMRRRSGEPLVTYRLNRTDARKIARGLVKAAEIMLAAGARTVLTGIPKVPEVGARGDLDLIKEEAVRPGGLKLTAFHPVGTARMGADPAAAVLDPWGEVHGVPGLFVTDASMLPGCPTVNPMVTIMAFATRTAAHVLRHGGRYF